LFVCLFVSSCELRGSDEEPHEPFFSDPVVVSDATTLITRIFHLEMSSSKGTSGVKSSFDAFAKVDAIVSKPVLGSDGAASWQDFRKDIKGAAHRPSAAPKAPLKKMDRLGTGFTSWEEERSNEDRVRKESGHVVAGSGYTTFKKKNSSEEAAERKRVKNVEARIIPEDKDFFIPSKTFAGWKFDYIFSTRPDRGTGYFWDGTDSIKRLRGELPEEETSATKNDGEGETNEEEAVKPKKKKRKKSAGPVILTDPNNPMEQLAGVIQRRNQKLGGVADPTLPAGWEAAKDPTSCKTYYFQRATGERSWEKPQPPSAEISKVTPEDALPGGWTAATDKASGKHYYYNASGETRWDRPSL
jgi:hypothetical protein